MSAPVSILSLAWSGTAVVESPVLEPSSSPGRTSVFPAEPSPVQAVPTARRPGAPQPVHQTSRRDRSHLSPYRDFKMEGLMSMRVVAARLQI